MPATHDGAKLPRPIAAALEYFWLSASASVAPAEPSDRRALAEQLAKISDRADAATLLWNESHGDSALDELRRAEELYRALREGPQGSVTSLAGDYSPPAEDSERTVSTFDARLSALTRAVAKLRGASLSPALRWVTRALRITALALFIALLATGSREYRGRPPLRTTASLSWGTQYFHDRAADRDYTTSWLLPDYTIGWIRAAFEPKTVSVLRLFNVRRLPSYGARECTVELELGGRVVSSQLVDMTRTVGSMDPYVLRLPAAVRADAVKITVRTYHGIGAGLAEIEVE